MEGVENARMRLYSDHMDSFDKMRWYFEEAKRVNPGSRMLLEVDVGTHRFERCFVSFAACIHGFKFLRPVIFLDMMFLKGRHNRILLGASCKDRNQGVFSLTFAVVSSEDTRNWTWFLTELRVVVGTDRRITLISDKHKGLVDGVRSVFPDDFHAFCLHHMKYNLRDKLKGYHSKFKARLVFKLCECAYAPDIDKFRKELESFVAEGGERVMNFVNDIPFENWTNAYFKGMRYGNMCSNIVESWNSKIVEARHLPIMNMIDLIRLITMKDLAKKMRISKKWIGILCPEMESRLQGALDKGMTWRISASSDDIFEVHSDPSNVVKLESRFCSCGEWKLNGFPCSHTAVVIYNSGLRSGKVITDCIKEYFFVQYYIEAYSMSIKPIVTSRRPESSSSEAFVLSHVCKKFLGRPKRKMIPSRGEKRQILCEICHKTRTHNRKMCKEVV